MFLGPPCRSPNHSRHQQDVPAEFPGGAASGADPLRIMQRALRSDGCRDLLRSRDNPAELVKSIQGFHRFAASTLAIAKKDALQMFATRLDKLQKDCAV